MDITEDNCSYVCGVAAIAAKDLEVRGELHTSPEQHLHTNVQVPTLERLEGEQNF